MFSSFINTVYKRLTISPVWFLIVFIFLNIAFKFYHLSEESIYGDEAYSIFQGQKPLGELTDIFLHDQNPPLHIALLHFWMQLFGISDISAKSLSILFSVLAGIVLFLFSKKYLSNQATILVSILFLFSNAQQFYSTEIRPYALIQFLSITSFYFYFRLLETPDKKNVFFLFLINLLLLFSHYLTIYIFIVQFICSLFFIKENKKGVFFYLTSQVLVVIAFTPWFNVLLSNIPKDGSFWNAAPNYDDFKWHVNILLGSPTLYYIFNGIAACSLLLLLFNNKIKFYDKNFSVKIYLVFLLLYALPIVLDFFVAQYTPVFLSRYILYSTFGLFLLVGYSIASLNTTFVIRSFIFIPLFIILLTSFKVKQEREDDWKSIMPSIKKAQVKKTAILISASYKFKEFSFYFDRDAFKDYNNTIERLAGKSVYCSPEDEQFGWNKLNFDTINKIIYVQSHSQFEDPENKIKQFILDKHFKVCDFYERINIAYTVYIRDTMDCRTLKIISSEEKKNCAEFNRSIALEEETGDTVTVFKADMEMSKECPASPVISGAKVYTGIFSCKINEQNQFSVGLIKMLKEFAGKKKINISAFVNYEDNSQGRLVLSIEKNDETFFRNELLISEQLKEPNLWKQITMSAVVPDNIPQDAELKIYFWNPAPSSAYIDDMQVQLLQ